MTRDLSDPSDAAWFWGLIGSGDGAIEDRVAAIRSKLETATDDDLADFDCLLRQAMAQLDSNELVAAVYLLMGYVSDNAYEDGAAWVVSLGREVWERVRASPDDLSEVPAVREHADDAEHFMNREIGPAEALHLLAGELWEERTGEEPPDEWLEAPRLEAAPDWDTFDWHGMLPRLCKLFPSSVAGLDRPPVPRGT